jgi:hypothetical protein
MIKMNIMILVLVSLFSQNVLCANFLATISIGAKRTEDSTTLRLKEALQTQLSGYQLVMNLDDTGNKPIIRVTDFRKSFKKLNEKLDQVHGEKKRLILSIAAHGGKKNNSYKLYLNNKDLSSIITGKELGNLIKSIDVDELIVIFQSCYSDQFMKDQGQSIKEMFANRKMKVSLILPTSSDSPSNAGGWENIIEYAMEDALEKNNSVLSYKDVKSGIMQRTCTSRNYSSPAVQASGLRATSMGSQGSNGYSPKFYELNMGGNVNLIGRVNDKLVDIKVAISDESLSICQKVDHIQTMIVKSSPIEAINFAIENEKFITSKTGLYDRTCFLLLDRLRGEIESLSEDDKAMIAQAYDELCN